MGIVIIFMASQMQSPFPGFGPEVFPSAIGILLAIFGGVLVLQSLAKKRETRRGDDTLQVRAVVITLVLTVFYTAGLLWIPFLICTPVYLTVLILMSKSVKEGRLENRFYPRIFAFTVLVSGMIYFVFRFIFRVALI